MEAGETVARALQLPLRLAYHDILRQEIPSGWQGYFHLAILRDVIEHLEDTELALRRIKSLLQPGGFLLVVFPPYPSPFGGHQHLSRSPWGKVPYLHLLPDKIFSQLLGAETSQENSEVFRLRAIKLSVPKFLRAVRRVGLSLKAERHYLLRPALWYRVGLPFLPIIPLTPFVRLWPDLLQYFCTEAGLPASKAFR
ncbi:MAG: class I SAM-dependent methyltransferase [Bacteroidia bacterium]